MARMSFTIPGPPMGKPTWSKSDRWRPRERILKMHSWKDWAWYCLGGQELPAAETTINIWFRAYFAPPSSLSRVKQEALIGTLKRTKPDGDNIEKCVCDTFWKNDQALGDQHITRRFDWEPRLEIEIEYEDSAEPAVMAVAA